MASFNAKFTNEDMFKATFKSGSSMNATFGNVQTVETGDYNALANKPQVNGETLVGDKSFEDLGDHTMTNIEIKAIFEEEITKFKGNPQIELGFKIISIFPNILLGGLYFFALYQKLLLHL